MMRYLSRQEFRETLLSTFKIKPPGPKSEYHMEWMGGLYLSKFKGSIQLQFGSRTAHVPVTLNCASLPPPYVIEDRNFCRHSTFQWTDEDAFIRPAKEVEKVFGFLGLNVMHGMSQADFEIETRPVFDEVLFGNERPYASIFTTDKNDWSRGYTPQPEDIQSSCLAYIDGLLYHFSFWKKELLGVEVTDVELVAQNAIECSSLPLVDSTIPPRNFHDALKFLGFEHFLNQSHG
jgi:hypothetical protein